MMPPGYSNYAANPIFSAPFLGLQIPQFSGPGGYSHPATQNTPPGQIAMAMQPHARGGEVKDSALAHAARLLHEAQRACGGGVQRAEGGKLSIDGEPIDLKRPGRSPEELLALWERVDRENLHVDPDRVFFYVLQRSPDLRRQFAELLSRGFSREAARVTMHNELVHAAKNANE